MARWFWYLSTQKINSLKHKPNTWEFLKERFGNLQLEAGVPWAKLKSSSSNSDPELIHQLEKIEKYIYKEHKVLKASEIIKGDEPIFFEFIGKAGKLVLRESYKGEDGDCVFLLAGQEGNIGVLLLGAGSNVFGSSAERPRKVDPSVDPVGSLLSFIDYKERKFGENGGPRAGRSAKHLNLEKQILYSYGGAMKETKDKAFTSKVRSLAIFTGVISNTERIENIKGIKIPKVDRVIIGSPIFVEQLPLFKLKAN